MCFTRLRRGRVWAFSCVCLHGAVFFISLSLICFLGSSSQRAACVSTILLLRMCGHCRARSCVGFLTPVHGAKAVQCEGDARCRFSCLTVVNRRTVCVSWCVRRLLRAKRWLSLSGNASRFYIHEYFSQLLLRATSPVKLSRTCAKWSNAPKYARKNASPVYPNANLCVSCLCVRCVSSWSTWGSRH